MAYWTGVRSHHHHHRETSRSHVSVFSAPDVQRVELHVRGRWVVSLFSSSISSPPGAFRSHCRHCSLLHVRDWNEAIACWRGIRHGEDTEDAARRATLEEEVLNSGVFAAAELVYQTQEQRHCSALLWVTLTDAGHLCSKQIDTPFVVRRNSGSPRKRKGLPEWRYEKGKLNTKNAITYWEGTLTILPWAVIQSANHTRAAFKVDTLNAPGYIQPELLFPRWTWSCEANLSSPRSRLIPFGSWLPKDTQSRNGAAPASHHHGQKIRYYRATNSATPSEFWIVVANISSPRSSRRAHRTLQK